jgi:parallel beta-helix repeat protein
MRILTKLALMVTAICLCIFYSAQQVSARTINVNCPNRSIQNTLNSILVLDGDTIRVTGNCNENIVIAKNRIVLEAVNGATLNGPNVSVPTISVKGLNVEIRGFASISGGRSAIRVERGGSAVIEQNTLTNSLRGILVIQSSYASIFNNTIENNVGNSISSIGIEVRQSSAADIIRNTIQNNQASGIVITDGSAADIDENTILNNGGDGILILRTSHARLAGDPASGLENFLQGNNRGVACNQNSSLRSDGPQDFGTGNPTGDPSGNTSGITGGCTVSGTVE